MGKASFIVGVGMTAFAKPRDLIDYPELAVEAATKALLDGGLNYDDIQQAFAGYVYGDSTCGQRALYALGMTGIPILNVNNNCSTGSSALWLARQAIEYGISDCVMALGFEKMAPGSLATIFDDRDPPLSKTVGLMAELGQMGKGPFAAQIFGNGGEEYCQKYGATRDHIASIAAKSHTHSANNPYAQFHEPKTKEDVLKEKAVTEHMTRAMCCPTSDGAACAIVCSEAFVKSHKLENQAIEIVSQGMATDSTRLFEDRSAIELAGSDMTRIAAKEAFEKAKITPNELQIIELHDCFAANELLTYDALGLVPPGKAHTIVEKGDYTYGGKWVINASGGLLAKGHPLGATGLGMAFYLVNQLRGWAGPMQDPRCLPGELEKQGKEAYALAHNLGLGGSCVVTIFRRPSFYNLKQASPDGRDRLGYNHGCECRPVTMEDVGKVRSKTAFSKWAEANL
ncbi:SPOSA6832_04753 [Sporobolomyces salmonicolor]|uniref:propanoyl-CoA C-acyltransferase n=1 Tax=Sporidiobolus salmonicolor TaxID=5005 RepID=A0A0D6ERY2_SPOSA|nr:SPOSA6832_04753 [Sporobolomyces salmonicolor]